MQAILILFVAGGCGTLCRYGLATAAHRVLGQGFPWGTATVNLVGSFAFGLLYALTQERMPLSPPAKLALLTGFMGAFTTFSTFMFDTGWMVRNDQWVLAALNVGGQAVLGLLALFAGLALGR